MARRSGSEGVLGVHHHGYAANNAQMSGGKPFRIRVTNLHINITVIPYNNRPEQLESDRRVGAEHAAD